MFIAETEATYFLEGGTEDRTTVLHTGMLWNRYNNYKKVLRERDLLKKTTRKKTNENEVTENLLNGKLYYKSI